MVYSTNKQAIARVLSDTTKQMEMDAWPFKKIHNFVFSLSYFSLSLSASHLKSIYKENSIKTGKEQV